MSRDFLNQVGPELSIGILRLKRHLLSLALDHSDDALVDAGHHVAAPDGELEDFASESLQAGLLVLELSRILNTHSVADFGLCHFGGTHDPRSFRFAAIIAVTFEWTYSDCDRSTKAKLSSSPFMNSLSSFSPPGLWRSHIFLEEAHQPFALSTNRGDILVGQLGPSFLDSEATVFPVARDLIPTHQKNSLKENMLRERPRLSW